MATALERLTKSLIPVRVYSQENELTTEWVRKRLRTGRLTGIRLGHQWDVLGEEELADEKRPPDRPPDNKRRR